MCSVLCSEICSAVCSAVCCAVCSAVPTTAALSGEWLGQLQSSSSLVKTQVGRKCKDDLSGKLQLVTVQLQPSYTTAQLHYRSVTLQPSYTTAHLHYSPVTLPFSYTTAQLHYSPVTLQSSYTTVQLQPSSSLVKTQVDRKCKDDLSSMAGGFYKIYEELASFAISSFSPISENMDYT